MDVYFDPDVIGRRQTSDDQDGEHWDDEVEPFHGALPSARSEKPWPRCDETIVAWSVAGNNCFSWFRSKKLASAAGIDRVMGGRG
jgi:hypothetical protein